MRAALFGLVTFPIVPSLLWPDEMAAVSFAVLQGVSQGAAIGFIVALTMNVAASSRR